MDEIAKDQNTALINIYIITFFLFPPSTITNRVPMTGENIKGVKNDTPNSP